LKQLTIEYPPSTLLSGPWRRQDLAEQSADVLRRRGVKVEVIEDGKRFIVVGAP
jgi:hypothetical protein